MVTHVATFFYAKYNLSMNIQIQEFHRLVTLFKQHGYILYLVGGTVRDLLLGLPLTDMDCITDATPEEMKVFLPGADYTFAKMGSIRCKEEGVKFDITTLRKEKNYKDSRHPTEVIFVKDLKEDVKRRDFTINAMYMDEHFILYDFYKGEDDLNKGIIRMVGDPLTRLREDPLRIIRAVRFALQFNFEIDKKLEKVMIMNQDLLKLLKKEKIIQDINKLTKFDENRKKELFDKFGITKVI